jgi:hypothetical protein
VSESDRPHDSSSIDPAAQDHRIAPKRHSASADAAALRWQEQHPEEDVEQPPPPPVPEDEHVVPNRHSASAEAAALRWHEQHDDEDS